MSLILISSPRFHDHTPPSHHPERPARADVFDVVAGEAALRGVRVLAPVPATREDLRRVHTEAYLASLDAVRGTAAMLDPDTYTSPESVDRAELAAGAAVMAVDEVLAGRATRALALVRPPGHHAEPSAAMGFCLLNSVAVAAASALARGLSRVAVVDFDVHHGNGTEKAFDEDPRVLFVSTHEWPLYPGTGPASHTGRGAGAGFTMNVPMEAGATDGDYVLVFDRLIVPVLDAYAPELVLVSAGFDAHERDPLAHMRMTRAGYERVTASLLGVADRHASGRVAMVTEGGYDLAALRDSLEGVVAVLEGAPPSPAAIAGPTGRGAWSVAEARRYRGDRSL